MARAPHFQTANGRVGARPLYPFIIDLLSVKVNKKLWKFLFVIVVTNNERIVDEREGKELLSRSSFARL